MKYVCKNYYLSPVGTNSIDNAARTIFLSPSRPVCIVAPTNKDSRHSSHCYSRR